MFRENDIHNYSTILFQNQLQNQCWTKVILNKEVLIRRKELTITIIIIVFKTISVFHPGASGQNAIFDNEKIKLKYHKFRE